MNRMLQLDAASCESLDKVTELDDEFTKTVQEAPRLRKSYEQEAMQRGQREAALGTANT